jgi:amino acid adenylation domain-containing protein
MLSAGSRSASGSTTLSLVLPTTLTAELQRYAKDSGIQLETILWGAWAILVSRYTREEGIALELVNGDRPGVRANIAVTPGSVTRDWLQALDATLPRGATGEGESARRSFKSFLTLGSANFDLTLALTDSDAGLKGTISYRTDLIDAATIERLAGHFRVLLEGIVARPDAAIGSLPILTETERQQIVVEWNRTEHEFPRDRCLHELIADQCARTPSAEAVRFEGLALSYRELDRRANQLAHLLQRHGVGPDSLVGVAMERSLELVVALLGILKAGGAYVPLDPTLPQERLAFMVEDVRPAVLLTQRGALERLPRSDARLVCVDEAGLLEREDASPPASHARPHDLAYGIYTSGSTGRPKCALNTHRGIVNRLVWMQDAYRLTGADRVLQKTPFSFDVSVWEFFWPLLTGACLVVARPEGHKDSAYLTRTIVSERITTLHFVPSMLQVFLEDPGVAACTSLKRVICSGEALPYDLQERFFARLGAELHNLYGPTEAAVDVTYWACERGSSSRTVPIGRPVYNTKMHVLDERLQPVPIGVAGELFIGGIQLARGYWNRPELTTERFIRDPLSDDPDARLYKTGDLARYRADGAIEYLGRLDFQVKIRGFRIELGEIEAALGQHGAVREVVVVAREDARGDKRLVAYLVARSQPAPMADELRAHLLKTLPDYMIPAAFVALESMPLNPNGKVDRKALPAPPTGRSELGRPAVRPRDLLEEQLASI